MKPQLDAEILPNRGLGGLQLRVNVRELEPLLLGMGVWQQPAYRLASPFEARYQLDGQVIEVAVDVRNGKVFKLTAYKGYKGTLFGKIAVGMKVADAVEAEPRLYYDEAEEVILCRGVEGVVLNVPVVDPEPADVHAMPIESISVYAEEIMTANGMKGHW